jgi:hypothetical protein
VVSGSRVEGTDQAKEPVLSIESAMVRMGTAFVEGPWRRSSEILSEGSVGVQVISKDWPGDVSRVGWGYLGRRAYRLGLVHRDLGGRLGFLMEGWQCLRG